MCIFCELWSFVLKFGDYVKKNDVYLVTFLTLLSLLILLFNIFSPKNGDTVIIYVNNEEYMTLPLDTDSTIKINDTNVLSVKNGEAFMLSATCPDHTCMKQSPISSSKRDIVCLPNKVVVKVIKKDNNSIDAISR